MTEIIKKLALKNSILRFILLYFAAGICYGFLFFLSNFIVDPDPKVLLFPVGGLIIILTLLLPYSLFLFTGSRILLPEEYRRGLLKNLIFAFIAPFFVYSATILLLFLLFAVLKLYPVMVYIADYGIYFLHAVILSLSLALTGGLPGLYRNRINILIVSAYVFTYWSMGIVSHRIEMMVAASYFR
jgi:hypothetical protein